MRHNPGEPWQDPKVAVLEGQDSPKINGLIEKLDRDLEETQKSASQRR